MGDKGAMGMIPKGGMPMNDDGGEMGGMLPAGSAPMAAGMSMGDDILSGMQVGSKGGAALRRQWVCVAAREQLAQMQL